MLDRSQEIRIAVVNDVHPQETPGAATIAYEFAKNLSNKVEVQFWFKNGIEVFGTNKYADTLWKEQNFFIVKRLPKYIREWFNFRILIRYIRSIYKFRPNLIWLNQIGNSFPLTIMVVNKIFKIKTLVTLHDFNLIVPRKLYPFDLEEEFPSRHSFSSKGFEKLISFTKIPKFAFKDSIRLRITYLVRLYFLRRLVNSMEHIVAISELQCKIYMNFGYRIDAVINNGIDDCNCTRPVRNINSIFFAGRMHGKGFTRLVSSIQKFPNWHLDFAGGEDLLHFAKKKLDSSQYTYHGVLKRGQLLEKIHEVSLVYVLSECFDVFPTITLESLKHGTLVITTYNTGNSDLVAAIDEKLILDLNSNVDFDFLEKISIYNQDTIQKIGSVAATIVSTEEVTLKYFAKFIS